MLGKLLDELLHKAQAEAVAKAVAENQNQSTTMTFGGRNSGFQASTTNGGLSLINFEGNNDT